MIATKIFSVITLLLILPACSSVINATRDKPIIEDKSERSLGEIIDDEILYRFLYHNHSFTDKSALQLYFSR